LTEKYVRQSGSKKVALVPDQDLLSAVERERVGNRPSQEKTRIMTSAFNLPYYQGILLYVLGITFPFFSILLLLPGKHSGFLMWFMLWFWAKSWDIGFAVAMLLDDVLFAIFQNSNDALKGAANHVLDPSMALTMFSMHEADPTFDMGTYYMIMGVVVQSIPVVSAYMILGSLKGGAGLIAAGMQRMNTQGRDFGTGTGMASAARNAEVSYDNYRARVSQQDDQMTRAARAVHGDRGGKAGLEGLTSEQRRELMNSGEGEIHARTSGFKIKGTSMQPMSLEQLAETGKKAALFKGISKAWLSSSKMNLDQKTGQTASKTLADRIKKAASGELDSKQKKQLSEQVRELMTQTKSRTKMLDGADGLMVGMKVLSSAVQNSANELYGRKLDEVNAWGLLDGSISSSARAQERAYVMNDGLTLSWTEKSTTAWSSSWEFSRTAWKVHMDLLVAGSKALREGIGYYKDKEDELDKALLIAEEESK
jgi:hypothetical protein